MDYNTQREHLVLPEYGRHVQQMVEYLLTITDRKRRSEQAALVVRVMLSQNPQLKRVEEQERNVWEHLYMICTNLKRCRKKNRNYTTLHVSNV